jgi:hypothetical protein
LAARSAGRCLFCLPSSSSTSSQREGSAPPGLKFKGGVHVECDDHGERAIRFP